MVQIYKMKHRKTIRSSSLRNYFSAAIPWLLCLTLALVGFTANGQENLAVTSSDEEAILTLPDSSDSYQEVPSARVAQGIYYDSTFISRKLRKKSQKLTVFGYYRLFLYGRNMTEPYPNLKPFDRAYGVGDGYREPMLSLNVLGRPSGKASFGTELFFFTPYRGTYEEGNVFTMNLGLNFYGNFRTKHGSFGIRAGGIHWYNLSPFTIGVFQILDRFSIFDRTPWEGVSHTEKYDDYFKSGATNPGDLRWNTQAFHGLIINGAKLPGDFSFDLFWGKTQPNGGLPGAIEIPSESIPPTLEAGNVPNYFGFAGTSRVIPSFITGGKIARSFGKKRQTISYNLIHSQTAVDSLDRDHRKYQVHSLGLDLKLAKISLTGELAMGSYESPTYEKTWGEALMLRFNIPKEYTFLPLDIQLYQISKDYFNQNGEIATNANLEILEDNGLVDLRATGLGAQMALVNQLVHNRRGINLNTGVEVGPAKFNLGWGIAEEIDAISTIISYVHRINGLALSRIYNPFPAGATMPTVFGPYGRKVSFFRGVSGIVATTDIDPGTAEALNRKHFANVDLQAKLKTSLLDRDLFFFYLASFGSIASKTTPIPAFTDDAYLFVQYHEFDVYYELFPKFLLTGYLGLEKAQGGQFAIWDQETQLPQDQFGTGIGIGFDWTIAKNSGLYVRHRWMNFEDMSFQLDKYKGREVTIELKTYF